FLEIPYINDLIDAQKRALHEIVQDGGAWDCYGRWLNLGEGVEPRDVLAQKAQSLEMHLVFPAFALARGTDDFKIMLFQHDGFSILFWRNEKTWRRRIERAVDERARIYNVPTVLKWSAE